MITIVELVHDLEMSNSVTYLSGNSKSILQIADVKLKWHVKHYYDWLNMF
jgi:hypothetical protein